MRFRFGAAWASTSGLPGLTDDPQWWMADVDAKCLGDGVAWSWMERVPVEVDDGGGRSLAACVGGGSSGRGGA